MSASYPGSIPNFTEKVDQEDINFAAHVNRLQDETTAITRELGLLPKGSYDSVRKRLDQLDSGKASSTHTHDDRYWRRNLVTSKGQILVGKESGVVEALSAPTNNRVLIGDTGMPTGVRWGQLTHSMFSDLGGDHYSQYALADASRGDFLPLAGGTMNGRVVLDGYAEKVTDLGVVSGAATLNATTASAFVITIEGDTSFTLSGATAGQVDTVTVLITQGGTGNYATVWDSSVVWVGSGPPTPLGVGEVTLTSLVSFDDGSTWIGISLSQY